MASIAKLIAGAVPNYTSCNFTAADFNSLANGSFVLGSTSVTNATNLDLLAEASFIATVGGTTTAGGGMSLWVLPLNRDGTTFGDTIGTGATLPSSVYFVSGLGVKVGVTTGNTVVGTFFRFLLPRGEFKFGLSNHCGVALNATAAVTCEYRTSNFNLNG